MPSSIPPEQQPQVKPFDPLVLDRAVIALPLLRAMQKDLADIERIRQADPGKLKQFNAVIEYNLAYPGGATEAHKSVLALIGRPTARALAASKERERTAREESR